MIPLTQKLTRDATHSLSLGGTDGIVSRIIRESRHLQIDGSPLTERSLPRASKMAWYHFLILFAQGFIVAAILTPLMRRVAPRLGFLDQPGERKVHHAPKPLLGGAAIFLSFALCVIANLIILNLLYSYPINLPGAIGSQINVLSTYAAGVARVMGQLIGLFAGATLLFAVGLYDDRYGLNPYFKLGAQVIAAVILYVSDIRIELFVHLWVINFLLTLGWLVLLTNSFNLLDNMDGLSGGVAMIALMLLGVATQLVSNQAFMSSIAFVLAGSIAGFLRYNLHPSSIFMGDAGSLVIGFLVTALTLQSTYYHAGSESAVAWAVVMPVVILAVPIFDTLTVILIRLKNRKPIFVGDKNHFSHRLVRLGMSQRRAVFFIHLVTLCVGSGALVLPSTDMFGAYVVLAQTFIIFILIAMLEYKVQPPSSG